MITDDEVMRLFERADPARADDTAPVIDAAGHLDALRTRTSYVTTTAIAPTPAGPTSRHRWRIVTAAAAAVVLIVGSALMLAARDDATEPGTDEAPVAAEGPQSPVKGTSAPGPSPSPTPGAPAGRLSRIVEGVPFSFRVPTSGWTPGPIERLPDASGFRNGSLYISQDVVGPQGAEAVVFWTSFPDGDHADPCTNLLSPSAGPSAADLAAAVATAPGTELVAGPSDVTVGGRPAKHVVLTVREDIGCGPGFFYTWQDEMWGPFWGGTNAGDTIRVWIVDVDGTRLFIEAETTTQAGPLVQADLEQEIQQIVESIRFD